MESKNRTIFQNQILIDSVPGLVSGVLYLSYILSFAFLIPIQYAFSAKGRKPGLITAATAFAIIVFGQLGRMVSSGIASFGLIASAVLPPALFLASMIFINGAVQAKRQSRRLLLAAILLSLISAPFVYLAVTDQAVLESLASMAVASFGGGSMSETLNANARLAVQAAAETIASAFSAFILWILAVSYWFGNRYASQMRMRRKASLETSPSQTALALADIRVPVTLLWPTLIVWASLFAVIVTKTSGVIAAAVTNAALFLGSLYAMQGIAILTHLANYSRIFFFIKVLLPLLFLVSVLNPTVGTIILIALPVLGITEVWFPYRNLKGA
ncbi:MAG: hypothetical protein LWX00_07855 [Spirochaetia bacterium]|nr:hypothetical protein [Spirochaetia bacterium]